MEKYEDLGYPQRCFSFTKKEIRDILVGEIAKQEGKKPRGDIAMCIYVEAHNKDDDEEVISVDFTQEVKFRG